MNTSRDIEKLFEHFGGNAGDYQEIGRENEARSARTRWPLLATLDFTQPPIPEVAQRRDVQLPGARGEADAASKATPINRGKPPLFARAHRRTIPPVGNVTLPAVAPGASRFADADAVAEPAEVSPPVTQTARPAAPVAPVAPTQQSPLRAFSTAPVAPVAPLLPSIPFVAAPRQAAPVQPAAPAPSILGKLFASTEQQTAPQVQAEAHPSSLLSVFDRLRGNAAEPAAPARTWAANRATRS
ncbi:hypothetical protein AWB67_00186 [Caballeronia terrestris]|uniref:Cellulose biosynthesis protein BcsR n=1 Tax=Caballeronia terrestris TaxID=1226301 RepID=A0A158EYF2_9BURK|nr:cellulose biosynthesis protein BcsP [Caballeronia terrestris]SAL12562.1 hypothetical protein AWB67_00186 [Caballeronia terrestris]